MTKVAALELKTEKAEAGQHHAAALIAALGNPAEWEYTGQMSDGGPTSGEKCACGHQIRYIFHITNPKTGKDAQVGSTCVDTFQTVNPALYERLSAAVTELNTRLAEAKKQAREAQQNAQAQALMAEYETIRAAFRAKIESLRIRAGRQRVFLPHTLYTFTTLKRMPIYVRKTDVIRWLTDRIALLRQMAVQAEVTLPPAPNKEA